jgi:hypothetical protein
MIYSMNNRKKIQHLRFALVHFCFKHRIYKPLSNWFNKYRKTIINSLFVQMILLFLIEIYNFHMIYFINITNDYIYAIF